MRDDAGREAGDADESEVSDRSGERTGNSPWDETPHGVDGDEREDDGPSGNVAGGFGPSETIEPDSPGLGDALFVVFGAYLAVLALGALLMNQGSGVSNLVVLTGGTVLVAIVCLGFFGLLTPDT